MSKQHCRSNRQLCRSPVHTNNNPSNVVKWYTFEDSFDNVECCFDIVAIFGNNVAGFGNKDECCFDKAERSLDYFVCCFDIVAGVDCGRCFSNTADAKMYCQQLKPLSYCYSAVHKDRSHSRTDFTYRNGVVLARRYTSPHSTAAFTNCAARAQPHSRRQWISPTLFHRPHVTTRAVPNNKSIIICYATRVLTRTQPVRDIMRDLSNFNTATVRHLGIFKNSKF